MAYILLNGLRSLLVTTHEVEGYLRDVVAVSSETHDSHKFLAIMICGVFLCIITLAIMI